MWLPLGMDVNSIAKLKVVSVGRDRVASSTYCGRRYLLYLSTSGAAKGSSEPNLSQAKISAILYKDSDNLTRRNRPQWNKRVLLVSS